MAQGAPAGGTDKATEWLDTMDAALSAFGDHDDMTGIRAVWARDDGRLLAVYALASWPGRPDADAGARDVIDRLLADYRESGSTTPLPDILTRWLLAFHANRSRPRQRVTGRNAMRDALIAATVNGIRQGCGVPFETDNRQSGGPVTACGMVAERPRLVIRDGQDDMAERAGADQAGATIRRFAASQGQAAAQKSPSKRGCCHAPLLTEPCERD